MRYGMLFVIVLAALSGCAGVEIRRDIYGETEDCVQITPSKTKGEPATVTKTKCKIGTVVVHGGSLTSEGAARLVASARELERTKQDGDAERRAADTARLSVEKGQPTSVSTRGGNVTSGYVGYGPGAYYGAGAYGPYGQYGPGAFVPGVAPEMVAIEAAGRMGGSLPVLGTPVATGVPAGGVPTATGAADAPVAQCPTDRPPATVAEQSACNAVNIRALVRARGVRK